MERVVILGRGGAGKSTVARELAVITGLPMIELDQRFWQPGMVATPRERWRAIQRELVSQPRWILDGDLGPYDELDVRVAAADTVIVLDLSLRRCAWRSIRRSRERLDYWRWVAGYRRRYLPSSMALIAAHGPGASTHVLRTPRAIDEFLRTLADTLPGAR